MIRFGLACLLIFNSVFGLYAAENGIHRVSRQDFNGAFSGPASYQQPFESRNGVYRVQRQDFTNTNDVPFSDSYQSSYTNRFSKLNFESGNVNRSNTPLPKLFLPSVQRVDNPYLSIGLPNYDRVVPASNFGREFQTRASAPTRVTIRPQITIYDEKRYDDGALPAISNSQDDSPLPSISEYSKSSPFDEDLVEQFELTEDRKSICKGTDCRKSSDDDAEAVKPIRKRRSLDYDPYYPYGRHSWHNQGFFPSHYRNSYHSQFLSKPFYDHENDRVYSYLNSLSKNRAPSSESSKSSEESVTLLIDIPRNEESSSTEINNEAFGEHSENSYNFDELETPNAHNYDPLLSGFDALVKKVEDDQQETTTGPSRGQETTTYDFNHDDSLFVTEAPLESANSNQDENITPIECIFYEQTTESQTDSDSTPSTPVSDDNPDTISYSTTNPDNSEESFYFTQSTTNSEDNSDATLDPTETTTNSDSEVTSDLSETTTNSEIQTETESPKYFDVDGKSLTPDQKFVVLFVCSMWPELYKEPGINSDDPETRNLNQLCYFLNSIDDHIVVDDPSGCDEYEPEVIEKPKSNGNEVFRNFFLQIIEEKNDRGSEVKPAEFDDQGNNADSASSSKIPVVLTLYDNISK